MKTYIRPRIERGEDVINSLSIRLETRIEFLHRFTWEEEKPQIFEAAKILRGFMSWRFLERRR